LKKKEILELLRFRQQFDEVKERAREGGAVFRTTSRKIKGRKHSGNNKGTQSCLVTNGLHWSEDAGCKTEDEIHQLAEGEERKKKKASVWTKRNALLLGVSVGAEREA
jgi:hypothetical protein